MNQNTVYIQTMIQTMAGKVIRDLRRGGNRELRNMMDLCRNRFSYPYYQQFCRMVEDALRTPNSQYGRLITRAARDVSETCLKTFLFNFGYHAVFCGGALLREQKGQNASQGIWLRPFPWAGGSTGAQKAVYEREKEGTSVFWTAQVETPKQFDMLLATAEKNRRCIFAVAHPPDTCTNEQLLDAVDLGNICFFLDEEQLGDFSRRLQNVGAFFGFHRSYAQVKSQEAEDLFLQKSIHQGCLMGVYEGEPAQSLQEEQIYQKLIQVRSGGTREIFLCDLWRDRDAVQKLLLHERTFPRCTNNEICQTKRKKAVCVKAMEKAKRAAISAAIHQGIGYLEKDPKTNIPKVMDLVDRVTPDGWYESQRRAFRNVIERKNHWYDLIMKVYELDPGVRNTFFQNFILNASLLGSDTQEETARREGCNVPWAILLDPTSACNMHCTGCWAAEYGNRLNLTFEELDSIVIQGKELGTYMYIFTGGEPLVRKKDVIALCEKHSDCEFLSFTNGTLIDEEFCQEMLRVKNFVPAISLEGFEDANDGRRGHGCYAKVMQAMRLLKAHKLPFGVSTCYTSKNYADISSEQFYDMIIEAGALFIWFFHYMPVGAGAAPELLPTPEQRTEVYRRIRAFRSSKPIFSMDFQNDAEYVGGCIAGGRRYLHINARGDVEPCVFIHYSNVNIRDCTLLEALKSPIFMAYHDNQPFNDNMLRPCPMLENPEYLRAMVKETGAVSTDYESPESADTLCDRTTPYAENWKPTADRLWAESGHSCQGCGNS